MQFLKHDSDDLIRKAAEEYPVQPFGMNWDAVESQLKEERPEKERIAYLLMRYAAMIVFFMLLSLVCNKYLRWDFDKRYTATSEKAMQKSNKESTETATGYIASGLTLKNKRVSANANRDEHSNPVTSSDSDLSYTKTAIHRIENTDLIEESSLENRLTKPGHENTTTVKLTPSSIFQAVTETEAKAKELAEEPAVESEKEKGKNNNTSLMKRLYAGLVFGPDISTVKFQKSDALGYNLGLILGYKFSDKWQLESGVLLNRKEYYSSGEYFNAGKMYLPAHSAITEVDGYCTMFELPLNVRYNINQKRNRWFATAGLSSYLMTKEDYDYTYVRYNNEYKGNRVYKNTSRNWLTAVNASIGYEHAINQRIQIRVEPYLKLPLRGMGTGKLPISSAGMNIGISYPLKY